MGLHRLAAITIAWLNPETTPRSTFSSKRGDNASVLPISSCRIDKGITAPNVGARPSTHDGLQPAVL